MKSGSEGPVARPQQVDRAAAERLVAGDADIEQERAQPHQQQGGQGGENVRHVGGPRSACLRSPGPAAPAQAASASAPIGVFRDALADALRMPAPFSA